MTTTTHNIDVLHRHNDKLERAPDGSLRVASTTISVQLGSSPRTTVSSVSNNNFLRLTIVLAVALSLLRLQQFPVSITTVSFQDLEAFNLFNSSSSIGSRINNLSDPPTTSSTLPAATSTNFTLQPFYQNPLIRRKKCSVTVLFVDPYLGKDSLWALESVAANILPLETACFLLKTSICSSASDRPETVLEERRYCWI